jgi:cell division septation protein DedD
VKGIFYTVQVGAYKTAVSSSKLFNLSPLFSYNAPNGYIRYNCGIYSSVPKAASAKDAIVSRTPIKDAFVVAYYNGERIEITKAATMLSNGSAVLSQNPHLDLVPAGTQGTQSAPTQNNTSTPPVNNNPAPAVTNTSPANNTVPANAVTLEDTTSGKIVFCVQIGAYSGQIPIDVANNLLKIASQGIHSYKEDDGVTTYTVGHYDNYASAGLLKEELVQDGFPGCFVVAYRNGKKISLKEAQAANNR